MRPGLRRLRDLRGQPGDLRLHRLRPIHRQVVGADRDIGLHTGRHVIADHFHDPSDGLGALGRLIGDLGDHDLPLCGPLQAVAGNNDVVAQALVVRHHETDAALLVQAPDHIVGVALQYLDHGALEPAAAVAAADPDHDAVTVKQRPHLLVDRDRDRRRRRRGGRNRSHRGGR